MKKSTIFLMVVLAFSILLFISLLTSNYRRENAVDPITQTHEYKTARLAVDEYEKRTKEYYSEENVKAREEQAEAERIKAEQEEQRKRHYEIYYQQQSKNRDDEIARNQKDRPTTNASQGESKSSAGNAESFAHMLARIEIGKPNPDSFTVQLWELILQDLRRKTGDTDNTIYRELVRLNMDYNNSIAKRSIFSIACDIEEALSENSGLSMKDACNAYMAGALLWKR